jgi:hypothetical protein
MQVKQESLDMRDKDRVFFFFFSNLYSARGCIRIATDGLSCCPAGAVCVEGSGEWVFWL